MIYAYLSLLDINWMESISFKFGGRTRFFTYDGLLRAYYLLLLCTTLYIQYYYYYYYYCDLIGQQAMS